MKRTLLLFLIGISASMSCFAQNNKGKLIGFVMDRSSKPVSYATISLLKTINSADATVRSYTSTKGKFDLTADTGKYILVISHVGFPDRNLNVTVKNGDNIVDTIKLSSAPGTLQNITITVRKPLIEQSDDRITYNVESDPASKTESATDLLRKTPMITVDGDGNVQLNGQSNFKILLNGRETSMFAQNVKDALRNFPGAIISKIEVITSPSAKYDAEGVGGIINIITKKKVIGYNGYLSSYYSTLSNYSESATLNLKSGKLGVSAYVGTSGSTNYINGQSLSVTTPFVTTAFSKRTLSGAKTYKNLGTFGNLEITYDLDSFRTIALYGNLGRFHSRNSLNQSIITEHVSQPADLSTFLQDISSLNPNSGAGVDFIKKYRNAPDKELDFRFNGQFSENDQENNSAQNNPARFVANNSISLNHEYTVQIDFAQPLKAKKKIETGAKAIFRDASSDFQSLIKYNSTEQYLPNSSNSDLFNYHQEVYSVYGSYSFAVTKLSFRLGIRAEHTDVSGNFITSKTLVSQSYTNIIPNFLVTGKLTNIYAITLSYNMRLQRPYITSLNPFVNNNDSLNISYGNPHLGSQILHAISIQNRFVKGKFFASLNLNGGYTNNQIVQFQSFNSNTGVTSTTSENAGREFQLSAGINLNTSIGDKLNVGMNTQLRYNHIENKLNLLQKNEGLSGLAAGNFNYKVIGAFTISGSGGVFRSTYTLLSSPATNYFYQVNFGYKFFKEKLALTMNVNNFHKKYFQYTNVTDNPYFHSVSSNTNPYRVIYFGATYNFGKLKENVSKKKGVSNDDLVQ